MSVYFGKQIISSGTDKNALKKGDNISELTNDSGYITSADITGKIDTGSLGTINGQSIENGNNITIDLTIFKVVASLPTAPETADATKIFLVPATNSSTGNVYIEYVYANSAWEKLGEYKSDVDLSGYLKSEDAEKTYVSYANLDTSINALGYAKSDDVPSALSDLTNDTNFKAVVVTTQEAYNALGDDVDENTLYLIPES